MSHIGIELRISLNGEPIMQANSDLLHFRAQLDAGREWSTILQAARSMLATADVDFMGLPPDSRLMIEARAVDLADSYPDPDEPPADDESVYCECHCSNCSGCLGS